MSRIVGLRRRRKHIALFARCHVEKFGLWIVRRRHPVRRARRSRAYAISVRRRRRVFGGNRPAIRILFSAPRNFRVTFREHQLSVRPVDYVKKSIAVCLRDQLFAAVVNHHRHLRCVVVMLVVLRELEIPF